MLSVSATTLQGPHAAGDSWTYQVTDSVKPGVVVVSMLTSTVVGPVAASSSPISPKPAATEINTTLTFTCHGSNDDGSDHHHNAERLGVRALWSAAWTGGVSGSTGTMNEQHDGWCHYAVRQHHDYDRLAALQVIYPASMTAGVTTADFTTTESISTIFEGSSTPLMETDDWSVIKDIFTLAV